MSDRDEFLEYAERLWLEGAEHETCAWIERTGTNGRVLYPAEPLGVSECGIMLRLDSPVELDEQLSLILGRFNSPLRLTLSCRVARLRCERNDRWIAACQFIPELPPEAVNLILAEGLANRRQSPRCAVSGSGIARWHSTSDCFDVEFIDLSVGGCCIRCRQPGRLGEQIDFTVEVQGGAVMVQAIARWSAEIEDGWRLVGCEFLGDSDFLNLNAALEGGDLQLESAGSPADA